jgi:hypothetical protein
MVIAYVKTIAQRGGFRSVACSLLLFAGGALLGKPAAAPEKAEPLLMRLDPQTRAKVVMARLGLVLVGVLLVTIIIVAAQSALRLARTTRGPTRRGEDDWYRKPLVPREPQPPTSSDSE